MIPKLKNKNYTNIKALSIDDIDINEKLVTNKDSFGKNDFKYFIVYKHAKKDFYAYFLQK